MLSLEGDVREGSTFDADFHVLVHLAGALPRHFRTAPDDAHRVNLNGARQAAEACRRRGARLVYVSTSGVYDRAARGALCETASVGPISAYAESKLAAEHLCQQACAETVVVRLFNPYGPGQGEDMLIGQVLALAQAGREVVVRTPASRRDFIHVGDVAGALLAVVMASTAPPPVLNVGSGVPARVADVVTFILGLLPHPVPVRWGADEAGDDAYADISLVLSALDWRPMVDLWQGVAALVEECHAPVSTSRSSNYEPLEQFPLKRKLRKARAALERPEANSRAFPLRRKTL
ncbi:MAG: SDR family oxidoreductase [Alphaproteobacteria bacterium]